MSGSLRPPWWRILLALLIAWLLPSLGITAILFGWPIVAGDMPLRGSPIDNARILGVCLAMGAVLGAPFILAASILWAVLSRMGRANLTAAVSTGLAAGGAAAWLLAGPIRFAMSYQTLPIIILGGLTGLAVWAVALRAPSVRD